MKFYRVILRLLFLGGMIGIAIFVSQVFSSSVNQDNIYSVKTEDYAIYLSNIFEENSVELNEYAYYKRNINLKFPQIYFSNEFSEYDEEIESNINKLLFFQCINNDSRVLINRDNRDVKEYFVDYSITKAENKFISIKYIGYLYSISHAYSFCYGITINTQVGEKIKLSEFIPQKELENLIKNKDYSITHLTGYNKEFIDELINDFLENNYNDFTNFFILDNNINVVLPVSVGNSNYIILEFKSIDMN